MAFNAQAIADRLIRNNGMACKLRRLGVDRDCFGVMMDFTPQERLGKVLNPTSRLFLLSAVGLDVPPDSESDQLVTFKQPVANPPVVDEILRIVEPPGKLAPAGVVIYWELHVSG